MEESAAKLRRAVELRPDSLKARLELGITYASMREKEMARAELKRVIDGPKIRAVDVRVKAEALAALAELE